MIKSRIFLIRCRYICTLYQEWKQIYVWIKFFRYFQFDGFFSTYWYIGCTLYKYYVANLSRVCVSNIIIGIYICTIGMAAPRIIEDYKYICSSFSIHLSIPYTSRSTIKIFWKIPTTSIPQYAMYLCTYFFDDIYVLINIVRALPYL